MIIIVKNSLQHFSSDEIALTEGMSPVDKVWPCGSDQVVPSYHAIVKSEHKLLLSVELKANVNLAPIEE